MKAALKIPMVLLLAGTLVGAAVTPGLAVGEFSFGVTAGATHDVNNLANEINRYNMAMEAYSDETPGSMTQTMNTPTAPAFGLNFRYQFNQILFRVGCHFATPAAPIKGYVNPAGVEENEIKITTFQFSAPASVAILLPIKDKTFVYMGIGLTYHQLYVKMTQSKPELTQTIFSNAGLSTNKQDSWSGEAGGYHFLIGAEVSITERLSLTAEWIHQEGRSFPLENKGIDITGASVETPKKTFSVRGDFALLGLCYYVQI
jgi:hypothetical protein